MSIRLHVTLREPFLGRAEVVDHVSRVGGLRDVNWERALEFGLISGTVDDPRVIDQLRTLPEVEAVEQDSRKWSASDWMGAAGTQRR